MLSEEQAGFRKGRSTVEQVFNCRNIIEKHLDSQKDLYHNCIDFKKAFDRVYHEGMWSALCKFGINNDIIMMIKSLYANSTSAVLLNNMAGPFFNTTVGLRQGCLLSPTLFNLFLEEIMSEIEIKHATSISVGGRPIWNLKFADDIDLLAGSNAELQHLTDELAKSTSRYGMEISAEKSKVMINTNHSKSVDITLYGNKLEEVDKCVYLGSTITSDRKSDNEIRIRLAQSTSAMIRLYTIWNSKHINFKLKYNLYRSLVLSILTYGCETWTISVAMQKKISAFENKAHRKLLGIKYQDRITNVCVRNSITMLLGTYEPLLKTIKRRKLKWFGHVSRYDNLCKTIMQGSVEGTRKQGRPKSQWIDNIAKWTKRDVNDLIQDVHKIYGWRKRVADASSIDFPYDLRVTG